MLSETGYAATAKITYGRAEKDGDAVYTRCKVFVGPHWIGWVSKAKSFDGYLVGGLYCGDKDRKATRAELDQVIRELAKRAPKHPKDCNHTCPNYRH